MNVRRASLLTNGQIVVHMSKRMRGSFDVDLRVVIRAEP